MTAVSVHSADKRLGDISVKEVRTVALCCLPVRVGTAPLAELACEIGQLSITVQMGIAQFVDFGPQVSQHKPEVADEKPEVADEPEVADKKALRYLVFPDSHCIWLQ